MSSINQLAKDLFNIITNKEEKGPKPYEPVGTVVKVDETDDSVIWVKVPGSDGETPVERTVDAKTGDRVRVRMAGGRAWIIGNTTSPPTDDRKANQAIELNAKTRKDLKDFGDGVGARFDYLEADTAKIHDLTVDQLQASVAYIDDLTANHIDVEDLVADHATIDDLDANYAHISNGVIDNAKIGYADVNDLNAHYATINLANVNNAWIQDGVIKDAAISDAQIIGVSANKITAGTIDASKINVTNLNADNLTVGTINGARIGNESISLDKLSEEVPTKEYLDGVAENLQGQIDGHIETWVGPDVPTLNNYPASSWTTTEERHKHVGDIYYVVADPSPSPEDEDTVYTDSAVISDEQDSHGGTIRSITTQDEVKLQTKTIAPLSVDQVVSPDDGYDGFSKVTVKAGSGDESIISENGFCYRFTQDSNDEDVFSWVLIQDSDVTAALQRLVAVEGDISGLKTFESETSSWKTDTDEELSSLKLRTTNVETSLGDKVSSTTFNELSQTVDQNTANITSLSNTVQTKADGSTVSTLSNTVNSIQQTADSNSSRISNLTTTLGTNSDGTTAANDIVHKASEIEQDLNGFKTTVSQTYQTKSGMSDYSTTSQMNTAIEQSASGIRSEVAQGYQTKDAMADYSTTAEMHTAIDQSANSITSTVSQTYATKSQVEDVEDSFTSKLVGQYATSSTAESNSAKTATIIPTNSDWSLYSGAAITVKFTKANTATTPTLNINGTGAKPIKNYAGSALVETEYKWPAGATMAFVYDGSNWRIQDSTALERIGTAESSITQTANSIISLVANTETYTKPDGTTATNNIKSAIKQNADNIELRVEKSGVIASINASVEKSGTSDLKISADKVNVEGAAIFTSGRLSTNSLNNTYAASDDIPTKVSDLTNDSGFVTDEDIPTKVSDLENDSGFITNADVDVSGKADKIEAIKEEQLIYKQAISGTNAMAAYPSSATTDSTYWVTETGESIPNGTPPGSSSGQTPRWTTKRPSYQTNYPVIFIAKQRKTVSGSITCTTPLKDDTTTIIDGGHITTGTIDAARLNINTIIAQNNIAVKNDIPDNLSDLTNDAGFITDEDVPTKVSDLENDSRFVTDEDIPTKVSDLENDSGFITNADVDVSGKADKTEAVAEEQYIYISKPSGTGSVAKNTTWVTTNGEYQNSWSTKRPTYNSSFPVLFVAKQTKMVSGTVTCTTPVKDDTTTVIDGGHITTGTIDAARINTTDLIANNSIVVGGDDISLLNNDSGFQTASQVNSTITSKGYQTASQVSSTANAAVNKYITEIDSDGIFVSPYNQTPSESSPGNSVKINGDGMEIYNEGESVAMYGSSARIGGVDGYHTEIDTNHFSISDSSGAFFDIAPTGATKTVQKDAIWWPYSHDVGTRKRVISVPAGTSMTFFLKDQPNSKATKSITMPGYGTTTTSTLSKSNNTLTFTVKSQPNALGGTITVVQTKTDAATWLSAGRVVNVTIDVPLITFEGDLILNGNDSPVGTIKDEWLTSDKSVSNQTGTALCSVSLEPGVWFVSCGVRFPSNSTGVRRANLSTTSGAEYNHLQIPAVSGTIQLTFTRIVTHITTTSYYLNVYHNAGSALTMPAGDSTSANYIRAVRIV